MTAHPEEPHSGLNRENNQRPDVNQENSEGTPEQMGKDPQEQRVQELKDAAKKK